MNKLTNILPAGALAFALMFSVTGCTDQYKEKCEAKGGKVDSDRQACGTKTVTSGSGTSKRTRQETKYKTEKECKDSEGREIMSDDDGFCS